MSLIDLSGIHAGTYILIQGRYGAHVAKIVRETPKQFVAHNGDRYSKTDGCKIGSKASYYTRESITNKTPTPEQIDTMENNIAEEARRQKVREHIESVTKSAIASIADRLGLSEDRIKVQAQSSDGLVSYTWELKIEKMSDSELLSIGG